MFNIKKTFVKLLYKTQNSINNSINGRNKHLPTNLEKYIAIIPNMTTTLQQRESANVWAQFCNWVTSTNN
ncbi:MAG: hypothetical protein ACOVQ7_04300, partial [Limnoraphis robusta]